MHEEPFFMVFNSIILHDFWTLTACFLVLYRWLIGGFGRVKVNGSTVLAKSCESPFSVLFLIPLITKLTAAWLAL